MLSKNDEVTHFYQSIYINYNKERKASFFFFLEKQLEFLNQINVSVIVFLIAKYETDFTSER